MLVLFNGIGPFKINGVPLRRVNQAYTIATSTKVDVSGVNVEKFDDKYFAKEKKKTKKKGETEFFDTDKEVVKYLVMFDCSLVLLFELLLTLQQS